jgi:hypothetical protein
VNLQREGKHIIKQKVMKKEIRGKKGSKLGGRLDVLANAPSLGLELIVMNLFGSKLGRMDSL